MSLVVLTALAGALIGAAVLADSRSTLRSQILTSSLAASDLAADLTFHYFNDEELRLNEVAKRDNIVAALQNNDPELIGNDLAKLQAGDNRLANIAVVDLQGNQLRNATNQNAGVRVQSLDSAFPDLLATGQPQLGLPRISVIANEPVVGYWTPVLATGGKVLGAVWGGIALTQLSRSITGLQISPAAQTVLVDNRQGGVILASPDPKKILTPIPLEMTLTSAFPDGHGAGTRRTSDDTPVFVALSPVQGLPVRVALTEPVSAAMSPVDAMSRKVVLYVVLVTVIMATLGSWLALRVTRPMARLRAAAGALAEGDLDRRVALRQRDEVGALGRAFDSMADKLQETLTALQAEIRERQRIEQNLEQQALHDPLTGLPNRLLLADRFAQAITRAQRNGTSVAFVLMDLNNFKDVNDSYGHPVGDELLPLVGNRVQAAIRQADTIARLGGDEFAILLCDLGSIHDGEVITEKIVRAMEAPFQVQEHLLRAGGSFGIAFYPRDGADQATVMHRADVAMYEAKRAGEAIRAYLPRTDEPSPDTLELKAALRAAVEAGDLALYYQPIVDLQAGRVVGAEALVRWEYPRGVIKPAAEFIPLVEQTDLIQRLTAWVLDAGLRQCRAWEAEGLPLRLAINLSMRDLRDHGLIEKVAAALDQSQVSPSLLTLELTEAGLMANEVEAQAMLHRLREIGVTLAIDDFGIGYTSMRYLKELPVQQLKIDKSFITDLAHNEKNEVVVRSIASLGGSLGLAVTAEGVEDADCLSRLRALGCDYAQGFYLGRPVPAAEFPERVRGLSVLIAGQEPA